MALLGAEPVDLVLLGGHLSLLESIAPVWCPIQEWSLAAQVMAMRDVVAPLCGSMALDALSRL